MIALYRPPGTSLRNFIEEFSNFPETTENLNHVCICGDFNIWLEDEDNAFVKEFKELIETHNISNGVLTPTSRSEHILDLILSQNNVVSNIEVEPEFTFSYFHRLVTFEINITRDNDLHKKIMFRRKEELNPERLIRDGISKMLIDGICDCNDNYTISCKVKCVNCYTTAYRNAFNAKYNEMCPLVEKEIGKTRHYGLTRWS